MNATLIRGIVRDGRVEFAGPIGLPDGTEVTVTPDEDEAPPTPEEIVRVLAAMERLEPLEITPEEAAENEAWERRVNEYTKANLERGLGDVLP